MKSREFVIFGGSGFIGTHLARRLSQDGAAVIYNVDVKPPREEIPHVTFVQADVRNLAHLNLGIDIDTIFNFAAIHTTPGHEPHEYYETNIGGALEITKFAERSGVSTIVFTSSISVYGPSEETKTETTPPNPKSSYGWSKFLAEQVHLGWVDRDLERKLVICRPAVIFGRGEGGNFTRLAKMLRAGLFVYPGRKDTIKACFYVKDLVESLLDVWAKDEKLIIYNGAYPDRYTIEQIVDTFREIAFPTARVVSVPRPIVSFAASLLKGSIGSVVGVHPERVEKLITSTDVEPRWLIENGLSKTGRLRDALLEWKGESSKVFYF
ncbi:MAG: NAD-dependent epimerase/dehydratase family protein [Rhodobacteraceae bacterium]|nr:NAD-dependent epimerase/dehydratase family protein [Paracoccaceae bacterium]